MEVNILKIIKGEQVPNFLVNDIEGKVISPNNYRSSKLLLSFYRYAGCPLCNLRVNQPIKNHIKLGDLGIKMIAVFESRNENTKIG